jgi:hypothetical protein
MRNQIVAIAQQQAQAAIRRAVIPAALGVIALVSFVFALIALFAALFFFVEPIHGPRDAALIVAAVALVLGFVALLFMIYGGRRPKATAPPATDPSLPQFVSLLAQTAPSLGPRQLALTAVVLALALGLTARGSSTNKK